MLGLALAGNALADTSARLIHDSEQSILEEQYGEKWAAQDKTLQQKLDALYIKHGKRPNIIHIMWDDNSFGEVGVAAFNKIRGFDTPRLNKMARDGITFTRLYTEPCCTPTRAAALTGRLAVRGGMHTVSFPPEGGGLPAEEVTIAEVLSIGEILDELQKQGIAENTLVVAMADNGPTEELVGAMYQNVFNGGKGSYKEGGIRVAAFAEWPGMIEADQFVGDMITVHDLYTTFARLGDAMEHIPTDRVIDGIDQTAVFLAGDGNSRRDYYHVYTGQAHAATIKLLI